MASFHLESGDRRGYRIRFRLDGRQRSVWLGQVSRETAKTFARHVDHIVDCEASGEPFSKPTQRWLAALSDAHYRKLSKLELVSARETASPRKRVKLLDHIDAYIRSRTDVAPSTVLTYKRARESAKAFFGAGYELAAVQPQDAERFVRWLETKGNRRNVKDGVQGMARNTVRRTVSKLSQFYKAAIKEGLVSSDPFAEIPRAMTANRENFQFIEWQVIKDCIDAEDDIDWKTLLALARLGGLRIPSELHELRWSDVDFANDRLTVRASKTKRYDGGGIRVLPLYPELRPFLEAARDAPSAHGEFVIANPRYRDKDANLRTRFLKIIKRAGHEPWQRLFQNLRRSRDTDLCDLGVPAQSVAAWMGHSIDIMQRHYLIARDADFERVAGGSLAGGGGKSGNKCGNNSSPQEGNCDR